MGFAEAVNVFQQVFGLTSFSGTFLIMQAVILIGSLVIMTRVMNDWKLMALPTVTGWHLSGIVPFHFIYFAITGVLFVIEALSKSEFSKVLGAVEKQLESFRPTTIAGKNLKRQVVTIEKERQLEKLRGKLIQEYPEIQALERRKKKAKTIEKEQIELAIKGLIKNKQDEYKTRVKAEDNRYD